jgi:light-regulated signal transduction histidine kinase (bacteriophytochrome)
LATGSLSETDLIALTLKAENGHQRIEGLITELNKKNDLSIISSLSEARVYTRYLFIVLFLLIFIIFIVAYRQFLAPLHRLRKEIRKLSEGSYSQIEIERDDEVGELIDAFNNTSRTLRLSEQKLNKVNHELATTNKELEAFAYSVSHDLRSPLRSISGFSDALVNNYASELSETAQDYLKRVHKAAIKMGELIDEILKLSRISSREIKRDAIDITELTHEIIELTKTDDEKHISFNVDNHLTLHGDAGLTKILLLNLLSNAIKFSKTKEHPVIKVGSVIKNGKPYIFVKDNGVGFDMKYADKIFGVFQRLHTNDAFKGTGIGLATVKRIINKHGGDIYLESEEGTGTTVYFNLEK